ncbi:MAG TPA: signal peptide peptidase SppA [Xanthobacteraceae bacterium]|nr:signal peptide peptidase SppA [Xanthobacteraceae bacterium]
MSFEADQIVDRRRLRRKVTFWRVVCAVFVVAAIAGGGFFFAGRGADMVSGPSGAIARVKIEGLIRSDQQRVEALERLGKSRAAAVIVRINSPGGTTAGSEELYDSLTRLRERKPVVVVVEGLAASGGYIAALGGEHIVARETSLVGSIGVLFQYPNVSELLKTVGVQVEAIKSSPLKAAPNGYEPTSPEARAAIEAVVMDSYAWFKRLVQERRRMDDGTLTTVSDGRIFTGRQATSLKLIDQIGDEKTAIAWLAAEKKISADLPVRDFRLQDRFGDLSFLRLATAVVLDAAGLTTLARRLEAGGALQAMERLNLDGLLALWHPPGTQ